MKVIILALLTAILILGTVWVQASTANSGQILNVEWSPSVINGSGSTTPSISVFNAANQPARFYVSIQIQGPEKNWSEPPCVLSSLIGAGGTEDVRGSPFEATKKGSYGVVATLYDDRGCGFADSKLDSVTVTDAFIVS